MLPALKRLTAPLLALLVAAPLAAQEPNRNAPFGLPGPAKPEPSSREAFLIARPQYVLSYNAEKRVPNWVAWELKAGDIGSAARAPFEPDPPTCPAAWRRSRAGSTRTGDLTGDTSARPRTAPAARRTSGPPSS